MATTRRPEPQRPKKRNLRVAAGGSFQPVEYEISEELTIYVGHLKSDSWLKYEEFFDKKLDAMIGKIMSSSLSGDALEEGILSDSQVLVAYILSCFLPGEKRYDYTYVLSQMDSGSLLLRDATVMSDLFIDIGYVQVEEDKDEEAPDNSPLPLNEHPELALVEE